MLFKITNLQIYSGKLAKVVPQSGFAKLLPKSVPQNTSAKRLPQSGYASNLFHKAILQSGSRKLLPKVATESCSPKLRFKATSQRCSSFKAAPPQSCSEQLLSLPRKIVSESGFPKLLSKAISQSYRFSKQLSVNAAFKVAKLLPTVAPQSCSSKLLPKAASQKRSPKFQC